MLTYTTENMAIDNGKLVLDISINNNNKKFIKKYTLPINSTASDINNFMEQRLEEIQLLNSTYEFIKNLESI